MAPLRDQPTRTAATALPKCGHKLLQDCPLTVDDWEDVHLALLAFRFTIRVIAERAHARAENA